MNRPVLIALLIVSLAVASGCSRRQQEWEAARRTDTVQGYERFLASFPDGEFASQAQARVRELQEGDDWQKAMRADTAEAYQEFVARHPQGRMTDEARIRIGNFALAQTPTEHATGRRRTGSRDARRVSPPPWLPPRAAHIASSSAPLPEATSRR